MTTVHDWLTRLQRISGTGLHLAAGRAPLVRAAGELAPLPGGEVLDDDALRAVLRELAGDPRWARFEREQDLDFGLTIEGERFLVNYFEQLDGMGAVFRAAPSTIRSLDELGAPDAMRQLLELGSGLVLVASPPGHGKSTSIAALVDEINRTQGRHVICLSAPIEFTHEHQRSVVSHREVGSDSGDMPTAVRAALRQDADVVVIDELEDAETAALALEAVSRGTLVLCGVRSSDAVDATVRLLNLFPEARKAWARANLRRALAAIVFQVLVPDTTSARVAAHEVLVQSPPLDRILQEGRSAADAAAFESFRQLGMQTMDQALKSLVERGVIDVGEATVRAADKRPFRRLARSAES